jgi:hypothetical protein
MRRILLVLTAAMVMALMTVAMALSAFAGKCMSDETGLVVFCSGGYGYGGGGGGGGEGGGFHQTIDPAAPEGEPEVVLAGGGGTGGNAVQDSGGGRCVADSYSAAFYECVGGGSP